MADDDNDDPLQAALNEASELIGTEDGGNGGNNAIDWSGFSIDDDDFGLDDDGEGGGGGGAHDIDLNTDPRPPPLLHHDEDLHHHPLADAFLQPPPPPPPPPAVTPPVVSQQKSSSASSSATSAAAAATSGMPTNYPAISSSSSSSARPSSMGRVPPPAAASLSSSYAQRSSMAYQAHTTPSPPQQQQQHGRPYHVMPPVMPSSNTGIMDPFRRNSSSNMTTTSSNINSASLDQFRASTSRLATNFVNMAQQGFQKVANSAAVTGQHQPHHYHHDIMVGANSQASSMYNNGGSSSSGGGSASPGIMSSPTPTSLLSSPGGGNALMPSSASALATLNQQLVPAPHEEMDKAQKEALVTSHVGVLLDGEQVIMFLANLLHVSDSTGFAYHYQQQPDIMWCCVMTYYRLILFAAPRHHHEKEAPNTTKTTSRPMSSWNAACWELWTRQEDKTLIEIPLAALDKVDRSVYAAGGMTIMGLQLLGKLPRSLRFTTANAADIARAQDALQTYAFPGRRNLGYLFAFEAKREQVMASVVTDGKGQKQVTLAPNRKRFDALPEFQRQLRLDSGSNDGGAKDCPWTIWTKINATYQLCASYPNILMGPATLDEAKPDAHSLIGQCAGFRSENRLPACSWASGVDGASLWRCAQPKVGLQGHRSSADELFLKHIMESAKSANALAGNNNQMDHLSHQRIATLVGCTVSDLRNWLPDAAAATGGGSCLKILDLRPRSAAMANRTGGYGYENTANYPGTTLQFCNIANIHGVRDAFQKVSALCLNHGGTDLPWTSLLEDTKWLQHVRLILAAAWETAFWIHVHRLPVLVHCSHGWDRTSQVSVLAQLLLDPYYRTCAGFACLIEKDFMSFGHPFHLRCGHGEGRGGMASDGTAANTGAASGGADEAQMSPIFIQLLDCVYQLVQMFPECFEFNTQYLLLMSEHVYSCRFGNFLCDSERERELVAGLRQRTHSIWDYLEDQPDTRNNASFAAGGASSSSGGVLLMPLPFLLRNVTLWTERHCWHGPKATRRRDVPVAPPATINDEDVDASGTNADDPVFTIDTSDHGVDDGMDSVEESTMAASS